MKRYQSCLVTALVVVLGIFIFFYYFGHRDDTALTGFSAAYEAYDRAIAAYAPGPGGAAAASDEAGAAETALADLRAKASARISSLTRNDGELMQVMPEIADLAGKELEALKAYKKALAEKSADADSLAKTFNALTAQRQAAYTRFQALESPK